jgi:hypothetical protein
MVSALSYQPEPANYATSPPIVMEYPKCCCIARCVTPTDGMGRHRHLAEGLHAVGEVRFGGWSHRAGSSVGRTGSARMVAEALMQPAPMTGRAFCTQVKNNTERSAGA